MEEPTSQTKDTPGGDNPYIIPAAIVVAGALIAGAVLFSGAPSPSQQDSSNPTAAVSDQRGSDIDNVRPVSEDDHIRGSIDAPVKLIEYSDLECPFCKRFHPTVKQVLAEYGDQVAWVWRHFPLTTIHPKAVQAAVASECAAEQGDNDAFWAYIDRYFAVTPSNNNIDLSQLPQIARTVGLDEAEFNTCLISGRHDQRIQDDFENATDAGGTGTPYSIVVGPDGGIYPINGAQPYERVKQVIDRALQN